MTPIQRDVLDYVEGYLTRHRYAPSFDEIAQHMGVSSKSNAHRAITALVKSGYLVRTREKVRNLALVQPDLSRVPTAALRAELESRDPSGNRRG